MMKRLVPKRRPTPDAVLADEATDPPGKVRVPRFAFIATIVGTAVALMLGLVVGVPALMRWQPGTPGQAGLQDLLNRLAAGEQLSAAQIWDPGALAKLTDGATAPTHPFGGPSEVREKLGWTSTFTVERAAATEKGPRTSTDSGSYPVFQESKLTLDGVEHTISTVWTMDVRRTDGLWRISWAQIELASSSLPATQLPGGFAPSVQQEVLAACGMNELLPWHTFDGDPVPVSCLLPSGVTAKPIDPRVRPLIEGISEGAPKRDGYVSLTDATQLLPISTDPVPLGVWRFEFQGTPFYAAFVPTADSSARLAVVVAVK